MKTEEKNLNFSPKGVEENKNSHELIYIEKKPVYNFFKRVFDILVSFTALVILFVPFLLLSLVIVIDSPGAAPIFSQVRVGKNGKTFRFYKFRSMVPNAENMLSQLLDKNEMSGPAFKIKDDPRITRLGRFIRRTGIDELPQLWNVLLGDMSLVGPRPPLEREVEMYDERQMQRLMVTPGITCLWQVQPQRNKLPFDEWLKLDLKYISTRGARTDLKILFKTIRAVWGMEGE